MGIFDGELRLIQGVDARDIIRRVSQDLFEAVRRDNIALEIDGCKIKLSSQAQTRLEITCEATNAFQVMNNPGNHPSRYLTDVTRSAPTATTGPHPATQSEMVMQVKNWLHEQRG